LANFAVSPVELHLRAAVLFLSLSLRIVGFRHAKAKRNDNCRLASSRIRIKRRGITAQPEAISVEKSA
jgi:hypothetical protein